MIIIGKKSPEFSLSAIQIDKELTVSDKDLLGSYTVLFFYALDFSFICPSEVLALQSKLPDFKERKTNVYGISVDSINTHRRWLATSKQTAGAHGVMYPLISDIPQVLSKGYGVFDHTEGFSLRATFILDEENIIQYGAVNTLAFGRSIDEILRTLDAIQHTKVNGVSCPANWHKGDTAIDTSQKADEHSKNGLNS